MAQDITRISAHDLSEQLNKRDLEIILEVNRKAIEIETGVADQNEEILSTIDQIKIKIHESHDKIEKLNKTTDEISKEIFKLQVLFVTGLLSIVVQIISFFIKK
jgi:hypothetical protein